MPEVIETAFYMARIDPASGALTSLKLKGSGAELLGGPANVVVAETIGKDKGGDYAPLRSLVAAMA